MLEDFVRIQFQKHIVPNGDVKTKAYCDCGTLIDIQTQADFSQLKGKILKIGTEIHNENKRRRVIGE